MFTGIIEELGVVTSLNRSGQSAKLNLLVSKNLATLKEGESVAVNGACLTVAKISRNSVEFDISPESLKRTTFQFIRADDKVNLERALPVSGRLGGHILTGHVDGIGEIKNKVSLEKHFELHISIPSELLRYLVPKGSIAIDGVSLTVLDIRDGLLIVTIIPQTLKSTTLGSAKIGDRVNIEVDILSKYIERHLTKESSSLTEDTLSKVGFFPMGWIDN